MINILINNKKYGILHIIIIIHYDNLSYGRLIKEIDFLNFHSV